MTNVPFYTQVSSQCRYPMYASGDRLYCVMSYVVMYPLEDSDYWTEYKENGMTKVIRGYATHSLFHV